MVDPELLPLVELFEALPEISPWERDPDDLRAELAALVGTFGVGPHVESVRDAAAVDGDWAVPVRVYDPDPGGEPGGVLVWFHGGGFVLGDLDGADTVCRCLAEEADVVVVSVDYRLAPEHPFPAAVDDALAATRWVLGAGDGTLRVDPARVAVGGDSAGGALAAVVARRLRDEGGPVPCFQLLVYPVADLTVDAGRFPSLSEFGRGHLLTADMMRWFADQYVPGEERTHPDASPLRATDLVGLAPAHVLTAGCDPLRDEGEAYAAALSAAGVATTHTRVDGALHMVLQMSRTTRIGARVLDDCADELVVHLGAAGPAPTGPGPAVGPGAGGTPTLPG